VLFKCIFVEEKLMDHAIDALIAVAQELGNIVMLADIAALQNMENPDINVTDVSNVQPIGPTEDI